MRDLTQRASLQKTNDPRDLQLPQPGGGLNNNSQFGAFHARGPYTPPTNILNNLPPPEVCRIRLARMLLLIEFVHSRAGSRCRHARRS